MRARAQAKPDAEGVGAPEPDTHRSRIQTTAIRRPRATEARSAQGGSYLGAIAHYQ